MNAKPPTFEGVPVYLGTDQIGTASVTVMDAERMVCDVDITFLPEWERLEGGLRTDPAFESIEGAISKVQYLHPPRVVGGVDHDLAEAGDMLDADGLGAEPQAGTVGRAVMEEIDGSELGVHLTMTPRVAQAVLKAVVGTGETLQRFGGSEFTDALDEAETEIRDGFTRRASKRDSG